MTLVMKMRGVSAQKDADTNSESVSLSAVASQEAGHVNSTWAAATPNASLTATIDNPAAHGAIIPEREYIVTIREAQPGE